MRVRTGARADLAGAVDVLGRATRVSAALATVRPVEPHWYLDHLGADPDVPRCGAGSALLAAGLARADGARVGTHLECKPANVDYYRRSGSSRGTRW